MLSRRQIYLYTLVIVTFNFNNGNPIMETKNFRITTLYHDPFVMPETDEYTGFKGLLVDLMSTLAARLKITLDFNVLRDGKYGNKSPNGSWNGIIGELVKQKADIGLAALTITPSRMKVVRFSIPFLTTGIVGLGRKETFRFGNQDIREVLKMAKEDKLVLGTLQGGSTVSFFRDSPVSTYASVDEEMQRNPEGFVLGYDDGINRVRNSHDKDYVFFGEKFILEHAAAQEPCDLKVLTSEPLNIINYGVAFAPNVSNKLIEDFNAALLDLQTYGTMQMLKQKWCATECRPETYDEMCTAQHPSLVEQQSMSLTTVNESPTVDRNASYDINVNELANLIHTAYNDSDSSTNSTGWKWRISANLSEE